MHCVKIDSGQAKELRMKVYTHDDIDMVKIDSDSQTVQIVFWPHHIIYGTLRTDIDMPMFRGSYLENLGFETEFYSITEEEANKLISFCQGYSVNVVDQEHDEHELIPHIGPQNNFSNLIAAFNAALEDERYKP